MQFALHMNETENHVWFNKNVGVNDVKGEEKQFLFQPIQFSGLLLRDNAMQPLVSF